MKLISLLLLTLTIFSYGNSRFKILWLANISPDREIAVKEDPFWSRVKDFMDAAAEDLDIDIDLVYFQGDFVTLSDRVEHKLKDPDRKPDLMIYHNFKRTAKQILDLGEKYKVKSLIFNSGINKYEQKDIGVPGERYKEWICEMLPNDEEAGYALLNVLADKARAKINSPLEVIAIAGSKVSGASIRRLSGLKRGLSDDQDLILNQIFYADWSAEKTYNAFDLIMGRYPETKIFWAASDKMAMSVVKRAEENGLKVGKDIFVGGFDWIKEVIPYLKEERMTASVGGHYIDGAWTLIVAYDYLNGKSIDEILENKYITNLYPMTSDQISQYKDFDKMLNTENIRKIDFKQFTKTHNRSLKSYDFHLDKVVKLLKDSME